MAEAVLYRGCLGSRSYCVYKTVFIFYTTPNLCDTGFLMSKLKKGLVLSNDVQKFICTLRRVVISWRNRGSYTFVRGLGGGRFLILQVMNASDIVQHNTFSWQIGTARILLCPVIFGFSEVQMRPFQFIHQS